MAVIIDIKICFRELSYWPLELQLFIKKLSPFFVQKFGTNFLIYSAP